MTAKFQLINNIRTAQTYRLHIQSTCGVVQLGKAFTFYPDKEFETSDEVLANSMRNYYTTIPYTLQAEQQLKADGIEYTIEKSSCNCGSHTNKLKFKPFMEIINE